MTDKFEPTRMGDFDSPYDPDLLSRPGEDFQAERRDHRLRAMEDRIKKHIDDRVNELRMEVREDIKALVPDGDVAGHKAAHVSMINSAKRWDQFKFDVLKHVVQFGSVMLAGYLGMVLWDAFKRGVNN